MSILIDWKVQETQDVEATKVTQPRRGGPQAA